MRVDVITAVHAGYAHFLPAAWASVLAQRGARWTWLVQADGDGAAVRSALAGCGAAADPRVQLDAHRTREGPAVCRNLALGRGTAPLVQNLDADDELEPDTLAVLRDALLAHPGAGYAVGRARDLLPDGTLRELPLPVVPGLLPRGELARRWLADPGRVPVHPAGVMWRRNLLVGLGGWSALHGMEDTGVLLAGSATAPGVHVDTPTLRYRRHPGQRSIRPSSFRGGGCPIRARPGPPGPPRRRRRTARRHPL